MASIEPNDVFDARLYEMECIIFALKSDTKWDKEPNTRTLHGFANSLSKIHAYFKARLRD
jgi:hypothetical protein